MRLTTESLRAKLLLGGGADISTQDNDGLTALMRASLRGRTDTVAMLVEAGADINATDNNGRTALMWAETDDVAKVLLEHGADIDLVDNDGDTEMRAVLPSLSTRSISAHLRWREETVEGGLHDVKIKISPRQVLH